MTTNEIYFSVDVESDGPIPGPNSMLSFGVAVFHAPNKIPTDTFERNLELLEGAQGAPDTMAWWTSLPQQAAWRACRKDPVPIARAMNDFVQWVDDACSISNAKPVFVAYPAGYDFLFVYWYMMKFVGRSPFSFSALDIKSFAMPMLGLSYRECVKKNMPKRWFSDRPHTHVALDDAIEQGVMFMNMLQEVKDTSSVLMETAETTSDAHQLFESAFATISNDMKAANHIARERFKMAREVRDAVPVITELIDACVHDTVRSPLHETTLAQAALQRIVKACDRLTLFGLEAFNDAEVSISSEDKTK